jgi:imidazolonepropionase-like amidohydrolase
MLTISNIRAGWLIDGTGGPVQKDVLLRIQHHIIQSIVPAPQDTSPFSTFQDLSEYTLLPSLVDCHVHLFMSGTDDIAARKRQLEAGYDEMKAVIPVHIARLISCGVGAVRDGGDGKGLVQQYRQSCPGMNGGGEKPPMRAGQATRPGIHLKVAGKAWHQCGRYGKLIGRSPSPGQTLAQAICREAGLPGYIRPDHIKVVNSGKLPVRIAIEAGCHSIEHGFFMGSDNLARMRDRQIVWVPTAFTMQAYADHLAPSSREAGNALRNLAHQMDQIRMARELGVPVAIGTDAGSLGVHHGDSVREEIGILMKAGYTLPEAIQCATKTGAGLLGVRDMGILSPGMPASWIAVKGGPSGLPESLDNVLHAE